jgi:hypothetical protein
MTGALADTLADTLAGPVAGFVRLFSGLGALSIIEVR